MNPGALWWTQPRLAYAACLGFAACYAALYVAVPGEFARLPALAAASLAITAAYRSLSRSASEAHRSGATRAAFETAIWQRRWRAPSGSGRPDLGSAVARRLQPDRRHGTRVVLMGVDGLREPLGSALRSVEAARLEVSVGWQVLLLGFAAGTLAELYPWPSDFRAVAAGGLLVPLAVIQLLSVLVDSRAGMHLLRSRAVHRVAQLRPRRYSDLVGPWLRLTSALLLLVGVARFWSMATSGDLEPLWPGVTALAVICVVAVVAAVWHSLRAVPLLRFPGPAVLSAYVDRELRQSRVAGLPLISLFFVVGLGALLVERPNPGMGPVEMTVFVMLYATMFAWRPELFAGVGWNREADELFAIAQRWGLEDHALESDGLAEAELIPAEQSEALQ